MKRLTLLTALIIVLSGMVMADAHWDHMPQQEPNHQSDFFPEEQEIDLTELKEELNEEVPGIVFTVIETAAPGQMINIEIIGEPSTEFLEEIAGQELNNEEEELIRDEFENQLPEDRSVSIEVASNLEYVKISQDEFEDPTIHVRVDMNVLEEGMHAESGFEEDMIRYLREGDIEYSVSGVRNRLMFTAVDLYLKLA